MTPKEKANDLMQKFYDTYPIVNFDLAKSCALICTNELIESHIGWATEQGECVDYYEEVRKELENLEQ